MRAGRRQTVTIEDDMDGDRELEDFEDEARTIELGNESDNIERTRDIHDGDDDETTELPPVSRKVRSYRKRSRAHSKTIALKRLTRAELALGTAMFPPLDGVGRRARVASAAKRSGRARGSRASITCISTSTHAPD